MNEPVPGAGLTSDAPVPSYAPTFPLRRPKVAILGAGAIARTAHLPAYRQYGVEVAGLWSRSGAAVLAREFPEVGRVYASADELLDDPAVEIVDIATPAAGRVAWIAQAVRAGKHVLAQKPIVNTAEDYEELHEVLAEADARGVHVAVNQNGRWAPAWRLATLLVRQGAVGEVVGVTHLHDKPLPPIAGTPFDDLDHMLIADYLLHWIDITSVWLGSAVTGVSAFDTRLPGQPRAAKNPWSATVTLQAHTGATASLRIVGNAVAKAGGVPFWIHGTTGTLRGSVLLGSDALALEDASGTRSFPLEGQWFVDGFAGTMGELMCAIEEERTPENSAMNVLPSVAIMLAAVESAAGGGIPVPVRA